MQENTYLAAQAVAPDELALVRRQMRPARGDDVLIRVEACGMCGADIADVERPLADAEAGCVPGHEVVGRVAGVGPDAAGLWQIGQRVGIGRLGGHCGHCAQCRRGRFQLCPEQSFVGSSRDGGYAEYLLAKSSGLIAIPDECDVFEAAPLLCAGVATFNALKKSGAEAGDLVAIAGIGGLGHMALQYARKMGFHVIALARNQTIAEDAVRLGAHQFHNISDPGTVRALQALGGAKAIVSTIGDAAVNSALIGALAPDGRLVLLSGSRDPVPVPAGQLIVAERSVAGSITGTPYETERTLQFSQLAEIRPTIETFPLSKVREAYAHLKSGSARFRIVLTMEHG